MNDSDSNLWYIDFSHLKFDEKFSAIKKGQETSNPAIVTNTMTITKCNNDVRNTSQLPIEVTPDEIENKLQEVVRVSNSHINWIKKISEIKRQKSSLNFECNEKKKEKIKKTCLNEKNIIKKKKKEADFSNVFNSQKIVHSKHKESKSSTEKEKVNLIADENIDPKPLIESLENISLHKSSNEKQIELNLKIIEEERPFPDQEQQQGVVSTSPKDKTKEKENVMPQVFNKIERNILKNEPSPSPSTGAANIPPVKTEKKSEVINLLEEYPLDKEIKLNHSPQKEPEKHIPTQQRDEEHGKQNQHATASNDMLQNKLNTLKDVNVDKCHITKFERSLIKPKHDKLSISHSQTISHEKRKQHIDPIPNPNMKGFTSNPLMILTQKGSTAITLNKNPNFTLNTIYPLPHPKEIFPPLSSTKKLPPEPLSEKEKSLAELKEKISRFISQEENNEKNKLAQDPFVLFYKKLFDDQVLSKHVFHHCPQRMEFLRKFPLHKKLCTKFQLLNILNCHVKEVLGKIQLQEITYSSCESNRNRILFYIKISSKESSESFECIFVSDNVLKKKLNQLAIEAPFLNELCLDYD